jgi:hypothetical protein
LPYDPRDDVGRAAGGKADHDADRPRRIGLRSCHLRDDRQRGSARGQMQECAAGKFHGVASLVFAMSRAIERGHAMRTDGEIERLSEMPADSIAAATTKIRPRHVPLAALR